MEVGRMSAIEIEEALEDQLPVVEAFHTCLIIGFLLAGCYCWLEMRRFRKCKIQIKEGE